MEVNFNSFATVGFMVGLQISYLLQKSKRRAEHLRCMHIAKWMVNSMTVTNAEL